VDAIKSAYITVCQAWKDTKRADAQSQRYWREAARATRRVVNRALKPPRLGRQLYVEELVFKRLWFGTPITASDLLWKPMAKRAALDAALDALDEALRRLPPPRSLTKLIMVASGSGQSTNPKYQAFRQLIYRHTNHDARRWLRTAAKEPYQAEVAYVPDGPSWRALVEDLHRLGITVVDSLSDLD